MQTGMFHCWNEPEDGQRSGKKGGGRCGGGGREGAGGGGGRCLGGKVVLESETSQSSCFL